MFITLEGPEGSGKTTQARRICEYLRDRGHKVIMVREPGGTALGDKLRELVMFREDAAISPRAELLLFAAARAQLVDEVIMPHLRGGYSVVCDRYADSTLAYQGYGRGLDLHGIRQVNHFATGGLAPDLTFLLSVPVEVGLSRNRRGQLESDRFERENLEFHRRVLDGYLRLAEEEPQRWVVVDATQSLEEVWKHIREQLARRA